MKQKMMRVRGLLVLCALIMAVLCAGCSKTAADKTPEQKKAESLHLFARNMNYITPLEVRTEEEIPEETEAEEIWDDSEDLDVKPAVLDAAAMLADTPLEEPYYMLWDTTVRFWGNVQFGELDDGTPKTYTKRDTLSGSAYEALIFDFLVNDLKLNVAAACGILANAEAECNFRPGLLESKYIKSLGYDSASYTASVDAGVYSANSFTNDHAGYGLFQWTYWEHKAGLLSYAKKKGVSISDYKMQLEYMYIEMQNEYKKVWKYITAVENTAQGAYDAGWYFCYYYERPAKYETSSVKRGLNAANKYWRKYGNFVPGRDNISVEIPHEASGQIKGETLSLSETELMLTVGETHRLKATTAVGVTATGVTWSSDNEKVAKVSSQGNVKGIKNGTCTITVSDGSGRKATCKVTVGEKLTKPVISVTTQKKSGGLQLNILWDKQELADGYTINISGPDTDVARDITDHEFSLTVKKSGTYKVKVTAWNDNDEASTTVNVTISIKDGETGGTGGEDEPETTTPAETAESPQETSGDDKQQAGEEAAEAIENAGKETTKASKETTKAPAKETTKAPAKETTKAPAKGDDAAEAIEAVG